MTEGMPESTIQVAVPSYPAEFGNEAYRIAETMEAGTAADQNPYGDNVPPDDHYTAASMQQQPHSAQPTARYPEPAMLLLPVQA